MPSESFWYIIARFLCQTVAFKGWLYSQQQFMKVSVFFTLSAHQILLYYFFRFFDDSQFYRQKKKCQLVFFFFSFYLLGKTRFFLKSFFKSPGFPSCFPASCWWHHGHYIGPPWPSDSLYQNANIVSCHRRFCQNITWLNFKPKYQQLCSKRRGRGSIK